jgi:hypothetical protein
MATTTQSKIRVIESETLRGAYDFPCTLAIIEHPKYGRLLIREGFGGMDTLAGGQYRWRHGVACDVKDEDTIESLNDGEWNEHTTLIAAVLAGYDPERPIAAWASGHILDKMARAAGL